MKEGRKTETAKMALYGAIQRLLVKANREYPFTGGDGDGDLYELDKEHGTIPSQLYVGLTLHPNCIFNDDWTDFETELGDKLLLRLLLEDES